MKNVIVKTQNMGLVHCS